MREAFEAQPESLAIVAQDFDRRATAVAKDIDSAAQGIVTENPSAYRTESINALAKIDRLGEGMLPKRDTVIQEGDLLHLVMREENADRVRAVFERGPEED